MADKQVLQDNYISVLCGDPRGRYILADVLRMCHFGETLDPDNKAMIAEHNVGMVFLAKCGIFRGDNFDNVVMALCSVALPVTK